MSDNGKRDGGEAWEKATEQYRMDRTDLLGEVGPTPSFKPPAPVGDELYAEAERLRAAHTSRPLTARAVDIDRISPAAQQAVEAIHRSGGYLPPRVTDQPPPRDSPHPCVQDMVMADMAERKRLGIERYGKALHPFNGRAALVDAYQELLDGAQYMRQEIYERTHALDLLRSPALSETAADWIKNLADQCGDGDSDWALFWAKERWLELVGLLIGAAGVDAKLAPAPPADGQIPTSAGDFQRLGMPAPDLDNLKCVTCGGYLPPPWATTCAPCSKADGYNVTDAEMAEHRRRLVERKRLTAELDLASAGDRRDWDAADAADIRLKEAERELEDVAADAAIRQRSQTERMAAADPKQWIKDHPPDRLTRTDMEMPCRFCDEPRSEHRVDQDGGWHCRKPPAQRPELSLVASTTPCHIALGEGWTTQHVTWMPGDDVVTVRCMHQSGAEQSAGVNLRKLTWSGAPVALGGAEACYAELAWSSIAKEFERRGLPMPIQWRSLPYSSIPTPWGIVEDEVADELESDIAEEHRRLNQLHRTTARADRCWQRIDEQESRLTQLRHEIEGLHESLSNDHERIVGLDVHGAAARARLDRIECTHLRQHSGRLDSLEGGEAGILGRLSTMESVQAELPNRLASGQAYLVQMLTRLEERVGAELAELTGRVADLVTRLPQLEHRIQIAESSSSAQDAAMQDAEDRLTSCEKAIFRLTGMEERVDAKLAKLEAPAFIINAPAPGDLPEMTLDFGDTEKRADRLMDAMAADELGNEVTVKVALAAMGRVPEYKSAGAAGADCCAAIGCERTVAVGQRWRLKLGVKLEIPPGYEGEVKGRSGLFDEHGIVIHSGTIDSDYRGEIAALLMNLGDKPVTLRPGERVAQLVIRPVARAKFPVVHESDLSSTERGERGFGSTGK